MRLGAMGSSGGFAGMGAVLGTVSASGGMPPAPPGYHWDFVISIGDGSQSVTSFADANQRVVALVRN